MNKFRKFGKLKDHANSRQIYFIKHCNPQISFFQLCTEEHAEATIMTGALIVKIEGDRKKDRENPGETKEAVEIVLVEPN